MSYKMEFNVDENTFKQVDPSPIKLPIRLKESSRFQTYGLRFPVRQTHGDKSDRSICSDSDYPLINQIWRHVTEDVGWRELHPPPCGMGGSHWNRTTVSRAMLRSLDPIKPRLTVIEGKRTDSDDCEGPFANYEFVKS